MTTASHAFVARVPGSPTERSPEKPEGEVVYVDTGVHAPPRPAHNGVPQKLHDRETPVFGTQPRLSPGTRIGRYCIQEEVGRGGMGVVYLAIDETLQRKVALKVVCIPSERRAKLKRTKDRIVREAQALARLDHPNVVGLYDVGSFAQGLYLAMEFVDGNNVKSWLSKRKRTWQEIVDVFVKAGHGLVAAHDAGLVHRDFKASNVLVGKDGKVRVVDFGLARTVDDSTTSSLPKTSTPKGSMLGKRITQTNVILGTAGYMSPEQLQKGAVGSWSDQFSFCVTLYESLYGHRPYPGFDVVQLADSFGRGRIVPPVKGSRKVPKRILKVLERGLSIDPAERFPTMESLLTEIQREPVGSDLKRGIRWIGLAVTVFAAAYAAVHVHSMVRGSAEVSRTSASE